MVLISREIGNYNIAVAYIALELYDALYLQKVTQVKTHCIKKIGVNCFDNDFYSLKFTAMGLVKEMVKKLGKILCFFDLLAILGVDPCTKHFKTQKLVMFVHITNQ